jgi:hypothetical protein
MSSAWWFVGECQQDKQHLRSHKDVQRICRRLDPYLGQFRLREITGDVIWQITQGELKRGNEPATVNRYLATVRNLLRTARDEWQWIEVIPKIRLLSGESERDRWLTHAEADRLIAAAAPHLKALSALHWRQDAEHERSPAWSGVESI